MENREYYLATITDTAKLKSWNMLVIANSWEEAFNKASVFYAGTGYTIEIEYTIR